MTRAVAVCARKQRARSSFTSLTDGRRDPLADLSHQIAHELRTPLNAVIGFSDLMRNELLGPIGNARYREYLQHISESAQQMLRAADQTLNITSILAAPKPITEAKPFNLAAALAHAAELAERTNAVAGPAVQLEVCPTMEVWGDDETVIAALAHLVRAAALTVEASEAVRLAASRLNYDSLALTVCTSVTAGALPEQAPNKPPEMPEGKLLVALAVSLLNMQGAHVETRTVSTSALDVSIEFELSPQQALAL